MDNRLGKETLHTPGWCDVEIKKTNWAEYPVTIKIDGFSINGSVEVSKDGVPTYLVVPSREGSSGDNLAKRLGIGPDRLDLECEPYHNDEEHSLLFSLLGSPWESWDQWKNKAGEKRQPSTRARGFAVTLENRLNMGHDEPVIEITPRSL